MAGETKSSDRVNCEDKDCNKNYASKAGMKDHMRKTHQSVVLSLVENVVNFLSPQVDKVSEVVVLKSPRELFTESDNEEDIEALHEACEDQEIFDAAVRADNIEALKVPIVPDGDWLSHTMPSGDLRKMLENVENKKEEASRKAPPKALTCVQCVLGKEENKKQDLLYKGLKQAKATLKKGFNRLESELKECQVLLDESKKEVMILKQKLETKQRREELIPTEPVEIVEEVVTTAGDWKTCEMCNIKLKGMQKLIKHQQSSHFTCTMCPNNVSWIGLSMAHLKIHHESSHGVKHSGPGPKCTPCKLKFPDAMSLNVHNLKKHPIIFKCTECDNIFKESSLFWV